MESLCARVQGRRLTDVISNPLIYYDSIGAALFPIPHGSKDPIGIISSFKHDFSTDAIQWEAWLYNNPGCNFGIVAFASNLIIVDIDTKGEDGRSEAWALWDELCKSWGLPGALAPHVQSPSGGWHCYMQVPDGVDAATLRQPDAIKKRINIRCIGYTVAAGSYYDGTAKGDKSGPYLLMGSSPPHPAPAALVAHCTRKQTAPSGSAKIGTHDFADVAALYRWMVDHDAFAAYEDWLLAGMVAKVEFGDAGLPLWELTHDTTVTPDVEQSKWASFAENATGDSQTLGSLLKRAYNMGWRGQVRKSTSAMFGNVAETVASIAQQAGATLPGVPMVGRGEKQVECGASILTEFLQITSGGASRPQTDDIPQLPEAMNAHGLYSLLNDSITRVFVLSESKPFKTSTIVDVLGILQNVNETTFESVCRRLRTAGVTLPDSKIKIAASAFSNAVERTLVQLDDWKRDHKGEIMHDNSDNVVVFLSQLSVDIRWNAWLEQMEVKGGVDADLRWSDWTYVDDNIMARLRTRANRTEIRFKPGKDFFWESLLAIAQTQERTVDPVLDLLHELEKGWDGVPRLQSWLATYCHTPDDLYHQSVGRAIIGGMVSRARHPGIKFDTMPVFFGPQGTGKSTLVSILALRPEYFTDTIMLGDASKELILALAGILCVEVSEMGMRGSANASHVKAMISRTVDSGRTAYARSVTKRPRRNIFCGTTNDDAPLSDPSGNRRFLPIRVDQPINLSGLTGAIGQIVGEAAHLEAAGANMSIQPKMYELAAQHQEAARSVSDMEARILEWFSETAYTKDAYVLTADLSDLSDWMGWKNAHTLRNTVLKNLGFKEVRPVIGGVRTRAWLRGKADLTKLDKITKYEIGKSGADGRVRVTIKRTPQPVGLPPLPPAH